MAFEAGVVVTLKSGGQPMTVVSASEDGVECIWIGEEGDFFRHSIPAAALEVVQEDDEDENDEDEHDEENEDETDGAEDKEDTKRTAA